jgi:hypothetical protein
MAPPRGARCTYTETWKFRVAAKTCRHDQRCVYGVARDHPTRRSVAREIEDAEFELEWFYTDPVLNVIFAGQRACLGIWDNGRVVAITGHEGCAPVVSLLRSGEELWRRWLRMARIGSRSVRTRPSGPPLVFAITPGTGRPRG